MNAENLRAGDFGFVPLSHYRGLAKIGMRFIYWYQLGVLGFPEDAAQYVHVFLVESWPNVCPQLHAATVTGLQSTTAHGVERVPCINLFYPTAEYKRHEKCWNDTARGAAIAQAGAREVGKTGYNMWANILYSIPLVELVVRLVFKVPRRKWANNCVQFAVEAARECDCSIAGAQAADKVTPAECFTEDDMLPVPVLAP